MPNSQKSLPRNKSIAFVDYKPAELRINKDWLIVYYAKNPVTGKLECQRLRVPVINNKTERLKQDKKIVLEINNKLVAGWSPFLEETGKNYKTFKEVINAFLKQLKTNAEVEIGVQQQLEHLVLQTKFDETRPAMPDQVKSKLLVALGQATIKQLQSKDEPSQSDIAFAQEAQAHLERAIELDDKCGGKQDLKTMETLLKKFPPEVEKQTEPLLNANGSQVVDDQGDLQFKPT